ncbi:MAG: superoxide dismutase [bacterium]|nr:superoxide dismutase [bacterium]
MLSHKTYPFTLPPLPYSYDALEPYIDTETMYFHHDKHMKTYVDNLNEGLKKYPQYHSWTLENLLTHLFTLPEALQKTVRDNGGGVYNHELYFDLMAPPSSAQLSSSAVTDPFGGMEQWKKEMKDAALGQFGSGFAWLVLDRSNMLDTFDRPGELDSSNPFRPSGNTAKLRIIALPNQDNPLSFGLYPILPLDVWEHAYYLKHQNLRGDYIDDWFHVIDWKGVENRLQQAMNE